MKLLNAEGRNKKESTHTQAWERDEGMDGRMRRIELTWESKWETIEAAREGDYSKSKFSWMEI